MREFRAHTTYLLRLGFGPGGCACPRPDAAAGERVRTEAQDLVEGRLAVHLTYPALGRSAFDTAVLLRGMGRVLMDVFDRPDELHAMLEVITQAVVDDGRRREAEGWLNVFPEDGGRYCRGPHRIRAFYPSQGFACRCCAASGRWVPMLTWFRRVCRAQHPVGGPPTIADEWPYVSDQTSAGLGPEQFRRFVLPYLSRMAVLGNRPTVYFHGCECLDQKMFAIMEMPNLKHFHVSPYTNLDLAVEHLREDLIIEAHSHPGTTFFAFSDEEVEADVRATMGKIAGRPSGLFLSDIHSINGRPERMAHWANCCRKYAAKWA